MKQMREKKWKPYIAGKGAPPLKLLCIPWENGETLEPKNQKHFRSNLSQDEVILGSTNLEDSSVQKNKNPTPKYVLNFKSSSIQKKIIQVARLEIEEKQRNEQSLAGLRFLLCNVKC